MNYLAHIYLSGEKQTLQIGNFMADSIKGTKYLSFSKDIQKGIFLHRAIDDFSDKHPIFKSSTKRLHKDYNHYSGVLVDLYYDHFLAKNWRDYSGIPLEVYINNFYLLLSENKNLLTDTVLNFLPLMISKNWLLSYQTLEGLDGIFNQMSRRSRIRIDLGGAVDSLKDHYDLFESEFKSFFKELIPYCEEFRNRLIK